MLHLRETLTMPANYYTDITDSISDDKMAEMKESVNQSLSKVKRGKSKMLESVSNDKIMSVLKEAKYTDSIVERVVAKLREGGVDVGKQRIYRVPVARINPPGTLNGNRRRYPLALWENVMNNQGDAWKGLCGLADHPSDDTDPGSFKNSSIVWLGMDIDKNTNIVYGIGTFVGPYGHLAQEIIDAGGRVGFSSSGFGELMSDGETVNPDTYQIERLADVVLNPSQSVYGSISDETNLGNIEYTKKQAVSESVETTNENRIQENTNMDAKELGVKSALAKVEERDLRKSINKLLKENVEITNPIQQLKDLNTIMDYIKEGQLTDLEAGVEEKLTETQKKIEEMVEYGLKMKEAEVSIEAGAPEDTKVEVSSDGAVEVTVGDAPVVEPTTIAEPVETAPVDTVVEPTVEPAVGDEIAVEGEPSDADIDEAIDSAAMEAEMEDTLVESKLTGRQSAALHSYVESFLNADHSKENPLNVIAETNEILSLVREGKLEDLEESVVSKIEDLQNQLNEDIENAHKMKLELQASSVSEINESAKSIMKSGKLLIDQVADYKELCEALTKRNQILMKEYNEMKANVALLEAKNEDNDLAKNQKIVSLSEKVNELTENFDNLDVKAGEKVTELQEALAASKKELEKYKEGNALLEKALGVANTKLKETRAKLDAASDELLAMKESVKEEPKETTKLTESKVFGPIDTTAFEAMKAENESLKAALATFKESTEKAQPVDMTKLDESTAREMKLLKDEIKTLKTRLGENVDNYVKTMEGSVTSYYNDLEAKYGEAIKPYKNSFLKARSLREAQRMFMNVVKELQTSDVINESTEEIPADTLTSGKTSDFFEGNIPNDAGSFAASFGLL